MRLWKFVKERILLTRQEYERGAIASGPCFHRYFNRSFVVPRDRFQLIIEAIDASIAKCSPDTKSTLTITAYTGKGYHWRQRDFETLDQLATYFNDADNRLRNIACMVRAGTMGVLVEFIDH